jgi:hypothetical protein
MVRTIVTMLSSGFGNRARSERSQERPVEGNP